MLALGAALKDGWQAKAAVAKAAANYDELMVQVEGAKVEMADARVDHADRGSSDSKVTLLTVTLMV